MEKGTVRFCPRKIGFASLARAQSGKAAPWNGQKLHDFQILRVKNLGIKGLNIS
jgi:hypothetical protein